MKYIKGNDRNQIALIPTSIEAALGQDNEVRLIDLFVDSLDLDQMDFRLDYGENGRPAYHPSDLLKLFIYGYLNKCRSSRDLEKECNRNIEVIWLLKSLTPDHNTISNFRRDNNKAIRNVFKATVELAKNFELIGGKLIAGDSTKMRAQNSKKNNYNKKKIDRHIQHIEGKLEHYTELLAQADGDAKKKALEQIDQYKQRKSEFDQLNKQLDSSGETQISTTDPDARNIMIRNHICEVAYSIQTTVDAENNIPIDYKLSNQNNAKAMGPMLKRAVEILGTNQFTALYDKGYHSGSELKTAQDLGIKTIVAIPALPGKSRAPNSNYNSANFIYNKSEDTYTCPQGQSMSSPGTWYQLKSYKVKHYRTKACQKCPAKDLCTTSKTGRLLSRSEYYDQYRVNEKLNLENSQLYQKRQAIVEHPYGTIKRQWGFNYIITKKGIEHASADVGLIFSAYNLRRLISIVGLNQLKIHLKELCALINLIISTLKAKPALLNHYRFIFLKG